MLLFLSPRPSLSFYLLDLTQLRNDFRLWNIFGSNSLLDLDERLLIFNRSLLLKSLVYFLVQEGEDVVGVGARS